MNNFDKAAWTNRAQEKWQTWWRDRLRAKSLSVTDLAGASEFPDESGGAWRNSLDLFLKGDVAGLQRVFSPGRKTKHSPEERLAKLAKAVSRKDDLIDAGRLWDLLREVQQDQPVRDLAEDPWHPAFAYVPDNAISIPAAWPASRSSREGEPLANLVKRIHDSTTGFHSSRGGSWVWLLGPEGSGRRHAGAQLRVAVQKDSPNAKVVFLDGIPPGGWDRFQEGNPGAIVIAAAENKPSLRGDSRLAAIEIELDAWGGHHVTACAKQLLEGGFVDEAAFKRLEVFGQRAVEQPELLGPDKRPTAVIALAAQVVAGAAPATPQEVRRTLRDAAWQAVLARLPDSDALRRDGQRLVSAFWALRLKESVDGRWWRATRAEAEAGLAAAAQKAWKLSAVRGIDTLLAALDHEKSKEKRSLILRRIGELARGDGAVLLEELATAGLFIAQGLDVEPGDRVLALLDATSELPDTVSPTVLADCANVDIPREWALHGHDANRVMQLLANCPLRVRPFAWRWLLEFAWQRRETLSDQWVRDHLVKAWAGVVLAELHGFGDVATHDPADGRHQGDSATRLLRDISVYWSGVLPDLDPQQPLAAIQHHVEPSVRQLLLHWLELRIRVAAEDDLPEWRSARWVPRALLGTLVHRVRGLGRSAEHAQFDEYAAITLWWLAPGQLLALRPGEVAVAYQEVWQIGTSERLQCQVRRAERGDRQAQAWLAGDWLDFGESGFPQDKDAGQSWLRTPVAVRLRWMRELVGGEPRVVPLLNWCLRYGEDHKEVAASEHWDVICAILERQPRDRLEEVVADVALPWKPNWRGLHGFRLYDGIRLAERFGFADILRSALETPQRWLDQQRAVRHRGKIVLHAPRAEESHLDGTALAFRSDVGTWEGLQSAEEFAHAAACALFRLGHPEHLVKRWTDVADWILPQALLSDLAALTHYLSRHVYELSSSKLAISPTVAAEGLSWLAQVAEDRELQIGFWVNELRGDEPRPPSVEVELGLLHRLAVDPRRLDIAAHELRPRFVLHGDSDRTSDNFWTRVSTPAAIDPLPEVRLAVVLLHALWLWAKPPLPAALAGWLDELEAAGPNYERQQLTDVPVAHWSEQYGLRKIAVARAAQAAQALLAFGDDTPLRDWIASLEVRNNKNWFENEKLDAVSRAVNSEERFAERAFRYAAAHPGPAVRQGEVDADRVLAKLEPGYTHPPRAAANWVAVELLQAPSAVCRRFMKSSRHEGDVRFLPVLRRLLGEATTFSQRMWYARRIHQLDPRDPSLVAGIKEWLGKMPKPFAGTARLEDALWQEDLVCGFEDFLSLAGKLWRLGTLEREELRAGVHRLASLIPQLHSMDDELDDMEGDSNENDATALARHQRQKTNENNRVLRSMAGKLLDLAVELEDLGLAEHVARCNGRADDYRLNLLTPAAEQEQAWLAAVQILDDEGDFVTAETNDRELAALQLADRGSCTDAVRKFAEHRLRRLLLAPGATRDIVFVMEIFHRLGSEDWSRAVGSLPPHLRTVVQAQALAFEYCKGRSTALLDDILMHLANESLEDQI